MPINSFLYPGAKVTTGYEVANSVRFNDGDTAYMHKTPSSVGDLQKFTYSVWFKRGVLTGAEQYLLEYNEAGDNDDNFRITLSSSDTLYIQDTESNTSNLDLRTNMVFRDVSAWYNLLVAVDTTQGTAANRCKVYVNGTQITSWSTETYPSQNYNTNVNVANEKLIIGRRESVSTPTSYFDGYMCEVVFLDGTQASNTDLGEFDEDSPTIWKPINVSGLTFGTNGFYLDFEDSSNLGNDKNGGTDLTEVNLAAADQATDTCTNNFATFNPLDGTSTGTAFVLSEGNCKGVTAVDTNGALQSTMAVSSGKWYAEFKIAKVGDNLSGGRTTVGIGSRTNSQVSGNYYGNTASPVDSYGKYSASAHYYSNNGSTTSYGSSFVDDDIIGVYLDLDNNKLYFSENGTLYSSTGIDITAAASTLNGHYHIGVADASANDNGEYLANYGGCPAFTISSAVSDDNGYGSFEYSPNITGDGEAKKFYALCTKNLAEFG